MEMDVKYDKSDRTLTIVCKVPKKLKPSSSGKTMIVFSSQGNQKTEAKIEGHPITIGLNAYYKNDE